MSSRGIYNPSFVVKVVSAARVEEKLRQFMNFPREFLSRPTYRLLRKKWPTKQVAVENKKRPLFPLPPPFNVGQLLLVESLAEKSNLFQTCTAAFVAAVSFSALLVRQQLVHPFTFTFRKLILRNELYCPWFFHIRLVESNPLILNTSCVISRPWMFMRVYTFMEIIKKEKKVEAR